MKLFLTALLLSVLPLAHAAEPAEMPVPGYPLVTCIVSDEPLTEMGKPYKYVHHVEGQPDTVVYFCCKGCVKDFQAEPAKYLAKLTAAAAPKTTSATTTKQDCCAEQAQCNACSA